MLPHHRPDERETLRFHLVKGHSVLQLGPRRVGKTWLVKRLGADLAAEGWAVMLCDVEGMSTELAFFEHLCTQIETASKLSGKATGRLRQVWDNLTTKDLSQGWEAALRTDWRAFATTLVRNLAAQGEPTVLIVDEIALFLLALHARDPEAARAFLYQLRALRQAYPSVRWLFTGSIGLDTVARRVELAGALVDLAIIPLEPFDETAAASFLAALAADREVMRPFRLEPEGARLLFDQLGWLAPFYLHHVAEQLRPTGPKGGPLGHPLATSADIAAAFTTLLKAEYRTYFAPWPEHLAKNFLPEETAQLRLILDICAETAAGELFDTLLARLAALPHGLTRPQLRERLDALVQGAFLLESDPEDRPRYRFRSGLLRRYWRRYEAA
jgi:hypothetical protein